MNNSVFISYRRNVSAFVARAIFQDLRANGIDAFMDVESLDSGRFDTVILNQIAARPYFLIILTPGTLDRCLKPGDWLLREMEHALRLKRVIVPLISPNFDFGDVPKYLKGKLARDLLRFNALKIDQEWFEEGMIRLRTRYLKRIDLPITPTPESDEITVQHKVAHVMAEPAITKQQLSAQDYFERALKRPENDLDGKIADYSEALGRNPQYAEAHNNRGLAYADKGDLNEAIADYSKAIRLDPRYAKAYNNRGLAYANKGDLAGAIADYSKAIRFCPRYAKAYNNRGLARQTTGDYDGAIADHTKSIELNNPELHLPYNNRGTAHYAKGCLDEAITDYNEAIRLNPRYTEAYNNRGLAHKAKGDLDEAIADYTRAIRLNPRYANAYYNRALAYQAKNDKRNALTDFQQLLDLDPHYPESRFVREQIAALSRRGISIFRF